MHAAGKRQPPQSEPALRVVLGCTQYSLVRVQRAVSVNPVEGWVYCEAANPTPDEIVVRLCPLVPANPIGPLC